MSGAVTYTVSKEQILKMAEACPTAKEVLKAGFPEAFEKEWGLWKEVPFQEVRFTRGIGGDVCLSHDDFYIFYVNPDPIGGMEFSDYKIEGGKIWRRKKAR